MKSRLIQISLLLLIILSAEIFAGENQTRYLNGYINNVDDNLISLTNNLVLRADRHITSVSMTPVTIILSKDRNEGYLYLRNEKVNVTLMQRTSGGMWAPAMNDALTSYNVGDLYNIDNINLKNGVVILSNGDAWKTKLDEDKEELEKWSPNTEVLVINNGNTIKIKNVITSESINVIKKTDLASDKSAN